jgi:hypothetical protein
MKFYVEFLNSDTNDSYKINFAVYDTDISKRWYTELKKKCNESQLVYEPDRIYDFSRTRWNEQKIVDELNICIDLINKNEIVIKEKAHILMDQSLLNVLHNYFEVLRGGVITPGEFWVSADYEQRYSLERYNVLIHRMESILVHKDQLCPRVVCTFYGYERKDLILEDYDYFKTSLLAGEVYINYCEVGKPLYDVFRDGDEIVGDDNIRPLRYYSPDFGFHLVDIKFSDMTEWWKENKQKLETLGFYENDKKNAIGSIPVARVTSEKTMEEIITDLELFDKINRVVCYD